MHATVLKPSFQDATASGHASEIYGELSISFPCSPGVLKYTTLLEPGFQGRKSFYIGSFPSLWFWYLLIYRPVTDITMPHPPQIQIFAYIFVNRITIICLFSQSESRCSSTRTCPYHSFAAWNNIGITSVISVIRILIFDRAIVFGKAKAFIGIVIFINKLRLTF